VWRGGVERDRPAGAELVLLEADPYPERAADDVAVLLAAVCHQRILGARGGADRVHDVEELDLAVPVRGEPFPAHARGQVDHASGLRPLRQPVPLGRRTDDAHRRPFLAEHVAHRHPELGDERVERADRRIDAVELDLRHEARRHADPPRELAEADPAKLSLRTQPSTDPRGLEPTVG